MVFQQIIGRLKKVSSRKSNNRSTKRTHRRRIQLERMEKRELLANDLAAISGVSFDDLDGNGTRDAGEPLLLNVDVSLYRDSNDNGQYDDGVDVLAGSDLDGDGSYRFTGLDGPDNDNPGNALGSKNPDGVGRYFIIQETGPGRQAPDPIVVDITDDTGVRTQLIDDYAQSNQTVTDDATAGSTTGSLAAPEAIGGFRDVEVTNNATGQVTVFADGVGSGLLSIGALGGGNGTALIQYDGGGNGITLDPNGLDTNGDGVSLGGGAPGDPIDPEAGFFVLTNAQNGGDVLTITVYSNGTSTSTDIIINDATGTDERFVLFSDFAPNAGIDFNDVGAIETRVALSTNNDVEIAIVESSLPNETIADVANITPMSLGGTLFFDDSAGGQNNGQRDGGEAAINNVTVELYQLANPDDTVDPETDTPLTSTTTSGTGTYLFQNLSPGHYAVVIPVNQFTNGAILDGFANSTGNDPAPDPDDDVDNDDNGITFTSNNAQFDGAVYTQTITLVSEDEPIDDADTDPNTNTTLDLGFFPQIDLGITKTLDVGNSNLNAGGNATFSFTVINNGPGDATGVEVVDVFPAGLTPTGITNPSGNFTISTNGNTVTVDIGSIPADGSVTFNLTADIGANQFTDLTNPASVSAIEVDINPDNDNDTAEVDLAQADLSIVKTDLQDPVNAGEQLTYQITVTNNGPDAAAGVQVVDTLPDEVTFVSGDVGGNQNLVSVDPITGDIIADIGAMANQATAVVTIIVTVDEDAPTPILNDATVTSTPNTDPDPDNNTTREDTTIDRSVDVEIDKTVSGSVVAGQVATYTVLVTNNGPSEARGIEVTDTLDTDLEFVANSFDPGVSGVTIDVSGQNLTFTVGTLSANGTATFTFDVMIDSGATGTIPNTAAVTTTDPDSDLTNNSDTADIVVDQAIDLVLTKTVNLATAVPGQDQLVYTFTVEHDEDSPSDATGVVVTDTLPAGVSGVLIDAATADSTDFSNGVITVTFNSLPVGATRTFTVTVDVNEDANATIVNPASVTGNETELDNTNNSDDATTTLDPDFDVVVTKTVSDASPSPLQTITYTVGLENEGPSTAFGVVLTDPIPAGLTLVSATMEGQNGSSNGTTVTFPAIDLSSGDTATATLTFTVNANATGTITNTANVPDMTAAGENDILNNQDSVDVAVTDLVDLRISKTVSASDAQVGDTLTYTITVTNDGPSTAVDVVATDTLPAGVTFVSGTGPNSEALGISNGIVTVDGGDLANAGSFTFTIIGTVDADASAIQTNTASVSTATLESTLANNTATASTTIDPMTASIGGSVYIDSNNNGIRDAGEAGIFGVTITLTGTDTIGNVVNLNTTTNSNGDYLFASLAAGTYQVRETQPAEFIDGMDTRGTGASAVAGDDVFTQLGLGAAAIAADFNFGELEVTDPFSKRRFLASSS